MGNSRQKGIPSVLPGKTPLLRSLLLARLIVPPGHVAIPEEKREEGHGGGGNMARPFQHASSKEEGESLLSGQKAKGNGGSGVRGGGRKVWAKGNKVASGRREHDVTIHAARRHASPMPSPRCCGGMGNLERRDHAKNACPASQQ